MLGRRRGRAQDRPERAGLRATSVHRSFEGVQALADVTLDLRPNEVLGLIGPNGAGKTTLVNVITGFDVPTEGSVELDGEDVTTWSAVRRGRSGLARTFQQGRLFGALTARENVEVAALAVGASAREARSRADELLDALELADRQHQRAASLPHGEQRKLGVARALATRPRYVLMDEPAAGLSEPEIPAFAALVRRVRDERRAGVLLVDHNVALIMAVCDRIQVLDMGRTIALGSPEQVRRDVRVADAYLGAAPAPAQERPHA